MRQVPGRRRRSLQVVKPSPSVATLDCRDAESQRVLAQAASAAIRALGREAADEYFDETMKVTQKAS
jgi:hypothetical protein